MQGARMNSALNRSVLKWLPLAAAVALAGCARDSGYYHDRNVDYADARSAPALTLPESRDLQRYRDAMPVPQAVGEFRAPDGRFQAPRPQALGAGQAAEREFVERRAIGESAWLVVGTSPDSAWPRLEDFARRHGMQVLESSAERGVIETPQGRLSVRQGLRADSSEVRCERDGQTVAACLDALAQHYAAFSTSASSLAAQRLADDARPSLEQRGEEWQVDIPLDIDRAWAELDHQLARDFTVEERRELLESDPDSHEFLVRYMTVTERNRSALGVVFSTDRRRTQQQIRLVLEPQGPEQSVLRAVGASERGFSAEDQRELLERVAGLLR